MNPTLTLAQIEARYDSEWVLLGEAEFDESSRFIRGVVLFHSKSRDEVEQKDMELRPPAAAILYTGCIPDDAAVVLSHTRCHRRQPLTDPWALTFSVEHCS